MTDREILTGIDRQAIRVCTASIGPKLGTNEPTLPMEAR